MKRKEGKQDEAILTGKDARLKEEENTDTQRKERKKAINPPSLNRELTYTEAKEERREAREFSAKSTEQEKNRNENRHKKNSKQDYTK